MATTEHPIPVDASMQKTYRILAEEVVSFYKTRFAAGQNKQHWVAIAGGPGSGKSTLSQKVSTIVNELVNDEHFSVVIPMDGYHISRSGLKAMSTAERTFEDLLMRRGAPWTFDPSALIRDLSAARVERKGSFPIYSRQLSDPVPNGVQLLESTQVVFIEGNYLLNFDDMDWAGLAQLFDEKWFISCVTLEEQRHRLIKRHLETWTEEKTKIWGDGKSGGAARKADSNDLLNAEFVEFACKKFLHSLSKEAKN